MREGAIVYDTVASPADLPVGVSDAQDAGEYCLVPRDDAALFGYAVGPHSWKKYLFPPRETLWDAEFVDGTLRFTERDDSSQRLAFIGVRACELAALSIQDRVFMGSGYRDGSYANTRKSSFVVAVNCSSPSGTCFCTSMGTGPSCEDGYDLVLTEVLRPDDHFFVVEPGSDLGATILERLPTRPASESDVAAAQEVVSRAAASMGRHFDNEGVRELLARSAEHPRWEEVATRCLACTNCTLVCPTCFCSTTEDRAGLSGQGATRTRRWDSCFNLDFSSVHGAPVRSSTSAMYRQWLTHKLSTWYEQFGTSGCVGCGRCITWCPVGIDITEEVASIRRETKEDLIGVS